MASSEGDSQQRNSIPRRDILFGVQRGVFGTGMPFARLPRRGRSLTGAWNSEQNVASRYGDCVNPPLYYMLGSYTV